MKADNPTWGAPRIHGELLQLGFQISEPTVSRYLKGLKRRSDEVSIANNASVKMSSRGKAFISMMKTAELRDLNNDPDTRDLAGKRALFVEAQMGPGSVIVIKVRSKGFLQMFGVQDHEMVQGHCQVKQKPCL